MFDLFKKPVPFMGGLLFPGSLPARPEDFQFLTQNCIELKPARPEHPHRWALELNHSEWGRATLFCPQKTSPPLRSLVEQVVSLTDLERQEVSRAGHWLSLSMNSQKNNILHDRKCALRFMHAIMGQDGLGAIDLLARSIWSPQALAEEVAHNADLDVDHIIHWHAVHAESDNEKDDNSNTPVNWLHSHGLAEIGFFDIDILRPSEDVTGRAKDVLRSLIFAIIEGNLKPNTDKFSLAHNKPIRLVPAADFQSNAEKSFTGLRDHDEYHSAKRSVACEPQRGFAFFRSRKIIPSKFLSQPFEDEGLIQFSHAASLMMAERARATYHAYRTYTREFLPYGFQPLIKIGYPIDNGGPDDLEHMWFSVNDLYDNEIDATLECNPFNIQNMKLGDRGRHPVNQLTDWLILSPAGMITPRNTKPVRFLRENKALLDEWLERAKPGENS